MESFFRVDFFERVWHAVCIHQVYTRPLAENFTHEPLGRYQLSAFVAAGLATLSWPQIRFAVAGRAVERLQRTLEWARIQLTGCRKELASMAPRITGSAKSTVARILTACSRGQYANTVAVVAICGVCLHRFGRTVVGLADCDCQGPIFTSGCVVGSG